LIIVCGVLLVLAIILYFLPVRRIKVPAVILGVLTSLAAGFCAGVLAMTFYGYTKPESPGGGEGGRGGSGGAGGMMGGGGGMRGGGGGMGGGMRGGGGRGGPTAGGVAGPSSRAQLVDLVVKLDLLTDKPLEVKLSEEQKSKIQEKLNELGEKEVLTEDDAKTTLDAILEIIKKDKGTLASAGFPPSPPSLGPRPYSNPFRESSNAEHLKALQARLGPKGKQ